MNPPAGAIHALRKALAGEIVRPSALAEAAIERSNQNQGQNTYLWQDADWTLGEVTRAEAMPRVSGGCFDDGHSSLWGLPISVKDCFDLAGSPTTCGVHFYRDLNGTATRDSWLVERLRAAGAVIVGKTHLHPLAYGITGENPEYGDCIQPGNPGALTGGSSSGACASVLEGSAVAAIGTDTGGSVRVPAALCGLAGYRSTIGRGNWRGGAHLAESFDTMGWLFRDLQDAPLLAAPFAETGVVGTLDGNTEFKRFAYVGEKLFNDCEPQVLEGFRIVIRDLETLGLEGREINPEWWANAVEIFAPIQASEAAKLHVGNFEHFQDPIRERLNWGAQLTPAVVATLRQRHAEFRARMDELFAENELLVLPCAPVARIEAGADHTQTRARFLRYTAPFSMAGVPAITVPCAYGGVQIGAARHWDEALLQLAAQIGEQRQANMIS